MFVVRYRITDPSGNVTTLTRTVIVSAPPVLEPVGPFLVDEGGQVTVSANATDPDGDSTALFFEWDFNGDGDFETSGATANFDAALLDGPSIHVIRVQVTDEDGFVAVAEAAVEVRNVAPVIEAITGPADPLQLGSTAEMRVEFSDAGRSDTHAVIWDWGDGTVSDGFLDPSFPGVAGSHNYLSAGVYTVAAIVTDDDHFEDENGGVLVEGQSNGLFEFVIIYDPQGGFVTGGGLFDSQLGDLPADPSLTSRANFGFVAKYHNNAATPTGETEFNLRGAGFTFHSDEYDWLVVGGDKAKFQGSGSVNGVPGYKFLVVVADGQITGGGAPDRFRIRIWEPATNQVVYDNQIPEASGPEIGGGNIKIHQAK